MNKFIKKVFVIFCINIILFSLLALSSYIIINNAMVKPDHCFSNLNFECEKLDNGYSYDISFDVKNNTNNEKIYSNLTIQLSNDDYLQSFDIEEFVILAQSSETIELNLESTEKFSTIKIFFNNDGLQKEQISQTKNDDGWFKSWGYDCCVFVMILIIAIILVLFWILSKQWLLILYISLLSLLLVFMLVNYLLINIGDINTMVVGILAMFLPFIKDVVDNKNKNN